MKSVFTISASLAISLMLCCTAQANDHKLLGAMQCRVTKPTIWR